jgi:hypothetical protein
VGYRGPSLAILNWTRQLLRGAGRNGRAGAEGGGARIRDVDLGEFDGRTFAAGDDALDLLWHVKTSQFGAWTAGTIRSNSLRQLADRGGGPRGQNPRHTLTPAVSWNTFFVQ